jgi:hypothetical protein
MKRWTRISQVIEFLTSFNLLFCTNWIDTSLRSEAPPCQWAKRTDGRRISLQTRERLACAPNVVTVERAANTAEQAAFIAELGRVRPDLKLSVKDSFACLNLRMAGLTPLFDARWLWRDEDAAVAAVDGL